MARFTVKRVRFGVGLLAFAALFWAGCSDDSKTPAPNGNGQGGTAGSGAGGSGASAGAAGSAGTAGTAGSAGNAGNAGQLPAGKCATGTAWSPGTPAFVERTAESGLLAIGAVGTRVNVADIDGDGYPDLLLRRGGTALDELNPGGTRRTWLLRNKGDGTFEDVTASSGVLTPRGNLEAGKGRPVYTTAFADVDNDGDWDLYTGIETADTTKTGGETSELMLNDGSGKFTLAPEGHGLRRMGKVDAPAGAAFTDIDLDGFVDLWIPQHNYTQNNQISFQQDVLMRNAGNGTFADETNARGLQTLDWVGLLALNEGRSHTRAWSGAACDLNGDGYPELLASSYGRSPNHLWQAVFDGNAVSYNNRSVASGYAFDGDQSWQDNQFARCYCQTVPTAEDCMGVPAPNISCSQLNWSHNQDRQPFRLGGNSGGTICADLNGDGHLDLLTTEIRHWWAGKGSDHSSILLNSGEGQVRFDRPASDKSGLEFPHPGNSWDEGHMSAAAFDFDNDGKNDIYIGASDYPGNYGLLYRQDTPGHFVPVATSDYFEHNRSHGVAYLDYDRDGDLDIIVGHSRSRCNAASPNNCYETQQFRLFENIAGNNQNWVQLKLEGSAGSNRGAIGARVKVTTAGGVHFTREVGGGHGHYGAQNDAVVHSGLGGDCSATVTITWPDAARSTQTFELPAGHRYRVVQGQEPVVDDGK